MVSDTDTPKVLYILDYLHRGTKRTVPFVPLGNVPEGYIPPVPFLNQNHLQATIKVVTELGAKVTFRVEPLTFGSVVSAQCSPSANWPLVRI